MASLEDRVVNLENLLQIVITNINATRQFIATGFNKIDDNFTSIHQKIDQLSGDTDNNLEKVHLTLSSIQEEISKINTVTNYDELVANMKLVKGGLSNQG